MTFPFAATPTFQELVNDISKTSKAGASSTAGEQSEICREQTEERPEKGVNHGLKNKALF